MTLVLNCASDFVAYLTFSMGCYTSKSSSKFARKSTSDVYRSSNLSQSEIEMRTEAPQSSESFVHCGISIKYAWASQRGYYPDSPDKDNQDCYTILPSIKMKDGSTTDVALFGVYDGHGTDGHLSSRYARNQVLWIASILVVFVLLFRLLDLS